MADWRYILGKSPAPGADPTLPLEHVAWLRNAKDRNLNVALNRAGDASWGQPTKEANPDVPILPFLFSGPDYCLIVERDKEEVFTGPLATNAGTVTTKHAGNIQMKAVGWLELLALRELREDVAYTSNNNYIPHGASWGSGTTRPASYPEPNVGSAWTDADIVRDLLQKIINYAPTLAPPIRWGGASGTRYQRQFSWTKTTKIEQCFRDLTEIEAGIDIKVDPKTRLLYVYSWDTYADREEVTWGFNKPPFNIETFTWNSDFFAMRNRLPVFGSNGINALAEEPDSQSRYGIFEETINLPEVKNVDTLVYYAHAERALKSWPWIFYNITPKASAENLSMLFRDFQIGDAGRLSLDHGPIQEDSSVVRLFAASVAIGDNGSEKLSNLQTLSNAA